MYWNTGLSNEAFKINLHARIAKKQPHTLNSYETWCMRITRTSGNQHVRNENADIEEISYHKLQKCQWECDITEWRTSVPPPINTAWRILGWQIVEQVWRYGWSWNTVQQASADSKKEVVLLLICWFRCWQLLRIKASKLQLHSVSHLDGKLEWSLIRKLDWWNTNVYREL